LLCVSFNVDFIDFFHEPIFFDQGDNDFLVMPDVQCFPKSFLDLFVIHAQETAGEGQREPGRVIEVKYKGRVVSPAFTDNA